MNLLISVTTNSIESALEKHFGRAPYFVIINTDTNQRTCLANQAQNQSSGAGVTAAQTAVDQAVDSVISGHFGPHAAQILAAAHIKMLLLNDTCQSIEDVLTAVDQNSLFEQKE